MLLLAAAPRVRRASLFSKELPVTQTASGKGLHYLVAAVVVFAVANGLIEGALLILFQRLNWRNWGAMLHVSAPIIWISPLVNLVIFGFAAALIAVVAKLVPKVPSVISTIFCLSFLTAYDWLTCIGRLYHWSCLLLALGVATIFSRWARPREKQLLLFFRSTAPILLGVFLFAFGAIHLRSWWRERDVVVLRAAITNKPNVLLVVFDTL